MESTETSMFLMNRDEVRLDAKLVSALRALRGPRYTYRYTDIRNDLRDALRISENVGNDLDAEPK